MTDASPVSRFARWLHRREDEERPCGLNRENGASNLGLCSIPITLRRSEAYGHRGFCSHDHAAEDQANQLV